ncbi:Ribosomal RNA small subunit methyltransferase B [Lentilactobacillus parabuchneri]|uniref:16S rRNA (cytosine(967)-C(5))-methyltransferase RsmB n=1 Tax=Lentilactobacillus parabuchneri TaxID=152331 RepID=UPI000A114BB8|nr:16S rRNA (cytosine(967)-C(5))-methyltransferase RsmB [Lentilactobacillus parabuchneri]ORN06290.1 Ribosomal RNA small subunit methyltransferase B [Lentilactobacillus parabuchneri]
MKYTTNNPRQLAVMTLVRTSNGSYSNLQINAVIQSTSMGAADKALFTNIVYGVIQHRLTLEYQLHPFLRDPEKTENWVKELLYTAMYQLEYLDRVPKRAIFDETIKIAKVMGHDGTRRFVTGILHQMDRKGTPKLADIQDEKTRLSVEYSVPTWLVDMLQQQLGDKKTTSILASLNKAPKQSVRTNTAKISRDHLLEDLAKNGFDAEPSEVSSEGIIINDGQIVHSDFFEDGLLTIQDESAMLPVESMTMDIHKNKLKTVMRNATRLGVYKNVETFELDARKVDSKFEDGMFDAVLVDAPCSGLGLLRRKPEIRYDKTVADIDRLSNIQLQILNAVSTKVKTGGTITYSTCTIVKQENQDVIEKFIAANPNFEVTKTKTERNLNPDSDMVQIYPDDYDSDGFFVCSLIRKS